MSNLVKMTVPGKPEFIGVCQSASIAAANLVGFDIDTVDEIGMAVYEACKGITCHGFDCWCTSYEMTIDRDEKSFTIIIVPKGEHSIEKCGTICLDCPREGDLAVAVIKSIMDDVVFENNEDGTSKKIIMVKNLC